MSCAAPVEVEPRIADVDPVGVPACTMQATHVVRGVSSIENCAEYEPSAACAFTIVSCRKVSGFLRIGVASCWNRSMNSAHGDLRGDLAARVPAHAVGDDEQQRVAAVGVGDPVLVDRARALARFLEDREPHRRLQCRSRCVRRRFR